MSKQLPVSVYAESTPNPNSMKFVFNLYINTVGPVEFTSFKEAQASPLAIQLFEFPFVTGVFIAANYITVSKGAFVDWEEVMLELRDFLRNYVASGGKVLNEDIDYTEQQKQKQALQQEIAQKIPETELEQQIVAILDEYVRPAVEGDGGNIVFQSFENGRVNVVLQGACSGCPSSTITLKAGIETLLKRMVPQVEEVVAVAG
ncbi:MAG: NifU family protein [Bacteroidia bacterium]|nr:NifU family protein [Bacteroidia bacterium]